MRIEQNIEEKGIFQFITTKEKVMSFKGTLYIKDGGKIKIILDIGSNLDDKKIIVPEIEGLFKGESKYDGVLISHYHGDHIGLATKILKNAFLINSILCAS